MKTKKIYWRLALLLSLIHALIWIVVWFQNGKLPSIYYVNDHSLIYWLYKILPGFLISRWCDTLGVFLFVFSIHNFPFKNIWNKCPNGYLEGTLFIIIMLFFMVSMCITASLIVGMNILIGYIVCIIDLLVVTAILYLIRKIPISWEELVINWIMQKD